MRDVDSAITTLLKVASKVGILANPLRIYSAARL
jgi:hypothetical protein